VTTSNTAPRGRPRDSRINETILAATVRLIGEHGYHGVSLEAIAAEAGVTRPTIYRRWATKALLAGEALNSARPALAVPADQGSLRGDLLAMILDDHRMVQSESGVVLGIAFTARHDPELGAALGRRLDHEYRARFDTLVDRAIARGELVERPDTVSVCLSLDSLILGTLLRRQEPPDVEVLTGFVDTLLLPALHAARHRDPVPRHDLDLDSGDVT
jgi:AcrR family transcriptional regulator